MESLKKHIGSGFFILTFGISWGCWLGLRAAGISNLILAGLLAAAGLFGPSLAGLLCSFILNGKTGPLTLIKRTIAWQVTWKAYLFAFLVPFALSFLPLMIVPFMSEATPRYEGLLDLPKLLPIFFGSIIFGGLSEELGWRGFALPLLRLRHGRVSASLIIGIFWGAWHTPIFGTGMPVASLIGFIILTALISILFSALADLAQDSLLPPILFHAAYNTFILHLPGLLGVQHSALYAMFVVLLVVMGVFGVLWWWRRNAYFAIAASSASRSVRAS